MVILDPYDMTFDDVWPFIFYLGLDQHTVLPKYFLETQTFWKWVKLENSVMKIFFKVWSPCRIRPLFGQVDPDCQALHGLCHRHGQHLALVAFHHFWTHRLHAGHISVPTHQKVLVNLIHLSPGKALLLLERKHYYQQRVIKNKEALKPFLIEKGVPGAEEIPDRVSYNPLIKL